MPQAVKSFPLGTPPGGGSVFGPEPPSAHLPLIQRFALADIPPESLYVRRLVLANDAVDRTFERFPVAVLQRFADTITGKSLLLHHERNQLPAGLFYHAEVRPAAPGEPGNHSLDAYFYSLKVAGNERLHGAIDAGMTRYASIGFSYDERTCSACGQDYYSCPHMPGEKDAAGSPVTFDYGGDLSRYEANEGSLVYLGAQIGAQIKGAPVDNEKALAKIAELEKQLAAAKPGSEELVALKSVHEEVKAELATTKAQLVALAVTDEAKALGADGLAYRAHLKEEIKRLAGILKCEAESDLLLTAAPNAEVKSLKALVDSYQARVVEKFPPSGIGHPATGETRQDEEPTGPAFRL